MAANYYLKNLNEAKKVEAILNKKIKEQNGSEMDEFIEMLSWVPVTFNNPKDGGTYTVQMKDGSIINAECTGSTSTSLSPVRRSSASKRTRVAGPTSSSARH